MLGRQFEQLQMDVDVAALPPRAARAPESVPHRHRAHGVQDALPISSSPDSLPWHARADQHPRFAMYGTAGETPDPISWSLRGLPAKERFTDYGGAAVATSSTDVAQYDHTRYPGKYHHRTTADLVPGDVVMPADRLGGFKNFRQSSARHAYATPEAVRTTWSAGQMTQEVERGGPDYVSSHSSPITDYEVTPLTSDFSFDPNDHQAVRSNVGFQVKGKRTRPRNEVFQAEVPPLMRGYHRTMIDSG